jgi:hypothetical protein
MRDGRAYSREQTDFFWSKLDENLDLIPVDFRGAVQARHPSAVLQRAVMRLADRASVVTLTGRLRANASYCARHNTVFQGLAADGAKLALWDLWRAGYRIVNFIHDEVLVEVPATSDLTGHAQNIARLMIKGMQQVVPDVRVDVKFAAADRWHKSAKAEFGPDGRLMLYSPTRVQHRSAETAAEDRPLVPCLETAGDVPTQNGPYVSS